MSRDSKKYFFLSFILTFGVGLIFLSLILPPVQAADVNVNATVPAVGGCGNGSVDAGEACDDGNAVTESCGDGTVQSGTYCDASCLNPITLTEQCETDSDCDTDAGETCNSCVCGSGGGPIICIPSGNCNVASWSGVCLDPDGDGAGTEMGTGFDNCGGPCSRTRACFVGPVCGNGFVDVGEECDDGNIASDDGCSATCQSEVLCGNRVINAGEECDEVSQCCSGSCTFLLIIDNVSGSATDTGITINWQTPCQETTLLLEWGQTTAVSEGSVSGLAGQNYSQNISGLTPNTVYYYRITAGAGLLQAIHAGSQLTTGGVEICDNGIDDDNDGLVDIADPGCLCQAEWECTPADWDQVECTNNQKTRTCEKTNNCWSNEPLPEETIGCDQCAGVTCPPNYVIIDFGTCECVPIPAECGNRICEPPAEDPYTCPTDCPVECLSDWECNSWAPEPCPASGIQARECFDRNACPIPINQPALTQTCAGVCVGLVCGACEQINVEQCACEKQIPCCGDGICVSGENYRICSQDCIEPCIPNWTALNWSSCVDGTQTREVYDLNNCDLDLDEPPAIRSCLEDCDVACSTCQQIDLDSCSCFGVIPCCGNNICEETERVWSCSVDCGLPPEFRIALSDCLDGLDNDGDGIADFPADLGCSKPSDNSELNPIEVLENIQEFFQEKVVEQILDNPQVEQVNETIATPVLVTTIAVNTFATFSFFNFFSYLQFFITQPFAALFRRKRRKWGVIYNSLSKQVVDLAIVRLYQKENGRLVQSRVTDKLGRYSFLVQPGRYYLTVTKPKFSFPSEYLKDKKEDVKYLDIYHGETIEVTVEQAGITVNIPIDPEVEEKPVAKIIFRHYLRKVQYIAAFSAVPLAAVSMIISPGVLTFTMFGFHCLLFVLFRRLGYQKPPKNWGIIYDKKDKKPIGRAITRIYDKRYNKLLETRVTDARGRYSFLVNNNIYYVTAERLGYRQFKTEDIDLVSKDREAIVGMDIGLEKGLPPEAGEPGETLTPPASAETSAGKPPAAPVQPSSTPTPPEGKIGVPAKLDKPETPPVVPAAPQPITPPPPEKPAPPQGESQGKPTPAEPSLEEEVNNLGVGKESLEDLLKTKEEIKEDIKEKKEESEEMEDKVQNVEETVEEKLDKIDSESEISPASAKASSFAEATVDKPAGKQDKVETAPVEPDSAPPYAKASGDKKATSGKPVEKVEEIKEEEEEKEKSKDKSDEPPAEKSIFG